MQARRRLTAALTALVLAAIHPIANSADVPHWELIPAESRLTFVFTQAGSDEQGHFKRFDATFWFDPDQPADSRFRATVEMDSVETGDDERDSILRSEDLLAVERWPQAVFKTRTIEKRGKNRYFADAELTLRDQTRPLPFPFQARVRDGDDGPVLELTAEVTLKRLEYGVGQGEWAQTKWVPDEVQVKVDVSARRVASP